MLASIELKKKIFIIISVLSFLSLVAYLLFYFGYLRFNYPSYNEYPIQGIDISHHQNEINWDKLDDEKISFVIIKATEGGDYKDPKFLENWNKSKEHGYVVGAYHFYRFCKSGKEQALNFIETVPVEVNSLPPSIDLEFGGNCETDKSQEKLIKEIQECLSILEKHYSKTPIIYATSEFYQEVLLDKFKKFPIWIRDIYGKPKLEDGRKWTFWQFANRGHLNGIDGFVDLNVFNGNKEDFDKLIYGG